MKQRMTEELIHVLRRLEEELHLPETRRNVARLQMLLHPDFVEFGRSGRRSSRDEVLRQLPLGDHAVINSDEFVVSVISAGVALLTYRSAHVDAAGNRSRVTLRSSLWIETATGWQMRFHQGTPSEQNT
jgi:hypothetical protein